MSSGGYFAVDADRWPSIANGLVRPWPRDACLTDLRWWADRVRTGRARRRPGRPALAQRWGVSDHEAKMLLLAEEEWASPLRSHQRITSASPVEHQEITSDREDEPAVSPETHQRITSASPVEHQRIAPRADLSREQRTETEEPQAPAAGAASMQGMQGILDEIRALTGWLMCEDGAQAPDDSLIPDMMGSSREERWLQDGLGGVGGDAARLRDRVAMAVTAVGAEHTDWDEPEWAKVALKLRRAAPGSLHEILAGGRRWSARQLDALALAWKRAGSPSRFAAVQAAQPEPTDEADLAARTAWDDMLSRFPERPTQRLHPHWTQGTAPTSWTLADDPPEHWRRKAAMQAGGSDPAWSWWLAWCDEPQRRPALRASWLVAYAGIVRQRGAA